MKHNCGEEKNFQNLKQGCVVESNDFIECFGTLRYLEHSFDVNYNKNDQTNSTHTMENPGEHSALPLIHWLPPLKKQDKRLLLSVVNNEHNSSETLIKISLK